MMLEIVFEMFDWLENEYQGLLLEITLFCVKKGIFDVYHSKNLLVYSECNFWTFLVSVLLYTVFLLTVQDRYVGLSAHQWFK